MTTDSMLYASSGAGVSRDFVNTNRYMPTAESSWRMYAQFKVTRRQNKILNLSRATNAGLYHSGDGRGVPTL